MNIPADWLEDQFRSMGLDAHVQNFSFAYPAGIMKGQVF